MRAHLIMAWLQQQSTRERPDTFICKLSSFDAQRSLQCRGGPYIFWGSASPPAGTFRISAIRRESRTRSTISRRGR